MKMTSPTASQQQQDVLARKKRGTTFSMTRQEMSEKKAQALAESERVKLVLGRHVKETIHGVQVGNIAYYEPSAYESQYENTLVYGASGSGKTWVGISLMVQSFLAEKRTWIMIDTKGSFTGLWRPNMGNADEIIEHGLHPAGVPAKLMTIVAPEYFMKMVDVQSIRDDHITHSYKIPLVLCGLALMFELTKLSKGASYAATFEVKFNELLIKTNNKPTVSAFEAMIDEVITEDGFPKQLLWVFKMMLQKIKEIAGFTIDEVNQWSAIGQALFKAAQDRTPRVIVFTLKHAKTPQDDVNLAMITAVLTEIKQFAEYARMHHLDIKLGVLIDELHMFVRKAHSTSVEMIHDLMFAWGRTSKLWRIYMTQKQEQLPKTFQDSIDKLKLTGTFQNIIACQHVPTPGFGKFLDRLHARDENSQIDETPRFYPKIKFMPPICEVESSFLNNPEWKHYWISKLSGKPYKPRTSPERPWEDIVADMIMPGNASAAAKARLATIHPSVVPARARVITTPGGTPLLRGEPRTIPEVNRMWAGIMESLGHGGDNA